MIAGILLAAGSATRMGRAKQLLEWQGLPLVRYIALQALQAGITPLRVVTGAYEREVRAALADLPLDCVANPEYAHGQATSLAAGIAALPATTPAVMVLLCDQPLLTAALLQRLAEQARQLSTGATPPLALVPRYQGLRGNPVVLFAELFAAVCGLRGDQGARSLLSAHEERIAWLELDDPAVVCDVDTFEQYQQLRASLQEQQP